MATIAILKNINKLLFEEHSVEGDETNLKICHKYIPKSRWGALGSNLRGNLSFMKKLTSYKDTNLEPIIKRRKKITEWQDYLTQQHMFHFGKNRAPEWNSLGLALHYLLDCYYHIYTKMLAKNKRATCFWCNADLGKKWSQVLSDVLVNNLPKIFLYWQIVLSRLDCRTHINELLDDSLVENSLNDVKFLVRQSIK